MTKFMPLQVAVRIAKIDALSAPGPGASVLDAYAMFGKPPLPILILVTRDSEDHVQLTIAIVRHRPVL
jgi:hypothetical protein